MIFLCFLPGFAFFLTNITTVFDIILLVPISSHYASLNAAEGGILVARFIGGAVANNTNIQPPKTTRIIVGQGKLKLAPCSSQKATYNARWKPIAITTPLIIPKTATQETSIMNDTITIDFR